jgi:hypothetical protein
MEVIGLKTLQSVIGCGIMIFMAIQSSQTTDDNGFVGS